MVIEMDKKGTWKAIMIDGSMREGEKITEEVGSLYERRKGRQEDEGGKIGRE